MRKLITIPMIHSRQAMAGQANQMGKTFADLLDTQARNRESEFQVYWDAIKEGLAKQNPSRARFYLEGFVGDSYSVEPGSQMKLPNEGEDVPPDGRIAADFIKRVGGTVETTEDSAYFEETFDHIQKINDDMEVLQRVLSTLFGSEGNLELDETEVEASQPHASEDERELDDGGPPEALQQLLDALENSMGGRIARMEEEIRLADEITVNRDIFIAGRIASTLQEGETGYLFLGGGHNVQGFLPDDIHTEIIDVRLRDLSEEYRRESTDEETDELMRRFLSDDNIQGTRI